MGVCLLTVDREQCLNTFTIAVSYVDGREFGAVIMKGSGVYSVSAVMYLCSLCVVLVQLCGSLAWCSLQWHCRGCVARIRVGLRWDCHTVTIRLQQQFLKDSANVFICQSVYHLFCVVCFFSIIVP